MRTSALLLITLLGVSCGGPGPSDGGSGGGGAFGGGTGGGSTGGGSGGCQILLPDAGCPWTTNPLALYGSAQMFVDTTVNVMAISSPSKVRVKPFDPDHSFIVQKLEGTLGPTEGNPMPEIGNTIPAGKIQLLRDWISQGANPN